MTTETEKPPPTNVIQALSRVMEELPAIGKKADPKAGVPYKFRGIEAITGEAQRLFGKYGVVFVPRVIGREIKDLLVNSKPWTDTILEVEYDIFGPQGISDKSVCGPIIGIGRDNSDKGANKAMTQAFKYALLQTLCISDQAADGDAQSHEADTTPQTRAPVRHVPTKPDLAEAKHGLKEILDLLGDSKASCIAAIKERFGESAGMTLEQINQAQALAAGWPDRATGPSD